MPEPGSDAEKKSPWIDTPGMQHVFKVLVPDAAEALVSEHEPEPILLIAPTGTGKTYVRDRIIETAGLKKKDWGSLNCAALTETLIESELFGHVRGAFTGALYDRPGLLAQEDKKLIVLDEINSLPKHLQAKLLTFLDDGEYRPVGSNEIKKSEMKVLAISNSKLDDPIFRPDFLYRFNAITIPPLHRRRIDIIVLLKELCPGKLWNRADLLRLLCYHWPGNVRQLTRFARLVRRNIPRMTVKTSFYKGVLEWFESPLGGRDLFLGIPDSGDISRLFWTPKHKLLVDIKWLSPLIWPGGYKDMADLGAIEQLEISNYIENGFDWEHRERKLQFWQDDWESWCAIFGQLPEDEGDILKRIFDGQTFYKESQRHLGLPGTDFERRDNVYDRVKELLHDFAKTHNPPSVEDEAETQPEKDQPPRDALGTKRMKLELMYEEMTPEAYKSGWYQHMIDTKQSPAHVARKFGLNRKTVAARMREHKKKQDLADSKHSHNDAK